MKYDVSIIGATHVATCRNLKEVHKALLDAQCVNRMTVDLVLDIADSLMTEGVYIGEMAVDRRWQYRIKVVR